MANRNSFDDADAQSIWQPHRPPHHREYLCAGIQMNLY